MGPSKQTLVPEALHENVEISCVSLFFLKCDVAHLLKALFPSCSTMTNQYQPDPAQEANSWPNSPPCLHQMVWARNLHPPYLQGSFQNKGGSLRFAHEDCPHSTMYPIWRERLAAEVIFDVGLHKRFYWLPSHSNQLRSTRFFPCRL
jgi:hypothetical protein